jgi:hypothetical protein
MTRRSRSGFLAEVSEQSDLTGKEETTTVIHSNPLPSRELYQSAEDHCFRGGETAHLQTGHGINRQNGSGGQLECVGFKKIILGDSIPHQIMNNTV